MKFAWKQGQAPFDTALLALTTAASALNNVKTNAIFKAACKDASTNVNNKGDRDNCVALLSRVVAMLNACQSSFISKLSTGKLKDSSDTFSDEAKALLHAPTILEEISDMAKAAILADDDGDNLQ